MPVGEEEQRPSNGSYNLTINTNILAGEQIALLKSRGCGGAMRGKRSPIPQEQKAEPQRCTFQYELLLAAVRRHGGRLRFLKSSTETLAITYGALRSLERRRLIEREAGGDPNVMTWKVTKAGKAAIRR